MASGDVKITVAADMAPFIQAFANGMKGPQQFAESVMHINRALQQADRSQSSMLGNLNRQLFGLANAFLGIGSTLGGIVTTAQVLRREYEDLIDRQNRAGSRFKSIAELEPDFVAATAGKTLGGKPITTDMALEYMHKRAPSVPLETLLEGATSGMSTAWILTPEQVMRSVAAYGRYKPSTTPHELAKVAAGVAAMMEEKWYTPEEAVAQLINIQAVSASTGIEPVAERIVPSMKSLYEQFGKKDDPRFLAAAISLIGAKAVDPQHRRTVTGLETLLIRMRDAGVLAGVFPADVGVEEMVKEHLWGRDDKQMKRFKTRTLQLTQMTADQLATVGTSGNKLDRALAMAIQKGGIELGGERRVKGFIEQFLVGTPEYRELLAAYEKDIPTKQDVLPQFERLISKRLKESRYQQVMRQARRTETSKGIAEISDTAAGMVGADAEDFDKLLASSRLGWMRRTIYGVQRRMAANLGGEDSIMQVKAQQLAFAERDLAFRQQTEEVKRLREELRDASTALLEEARAARDKTTTIRVEGADGSRRPAKPAVPGNRPRPLSYREWTAQQRERR